MNLKNYTSSVPAHNTISLIEAYLASCHVSGIAKKFTGGIPTDILFEISEGGRNYCVKLPANIQGVWDFLWTDYVAGLSNKQKPRKSKDDFKDQACRTAWKIQQDWIQVQMSLIKLKQATFRQVFLAYLFDGKETYYEYLQGNNFKALPEKSSQ